MARAKTIWVVYCVEYRGIVGAFTVKHEMISWIKKHRSISGDGLMERWEIFKVEDEEYQLPYDGKVHFTAEDILNEELPKKASS